MKKPEKKELFNEEIVPKHYHGREKQYVEDLRLTIEGYNQALTEYEEWLPGVEEIEKMVRDIAVLIEPPVLGECTLSHWKCLPSTLATTISKRIKGEKNE